MKGIISMYKSSAVKYMVDNKIEKKDAIVMCTQADVDANRHSVDEILIVDKPWRGFDVEAVTLYLCKPKLDEPTSKKDFKVRIVPNRSSLETIKENPVTPEEAFEKAPVPTKTPKAVKKPAKATPKIEPVKKVNPKAKK